CQVCHRQDAEVLRQNVYDRQEKCNEVRDRAEQELARFLHRGLYHKVKNMQMSNCRVCKILIARGKLGQKLIL
ncbi:MAG: ammonia-forming cytochrome c nitrite reductase subunit c552, partial [Lachnospiraceae bacterium]|nr:ammonia-forming cytochrome c nitrite reductase subunit c552 [Lachnospiraceae bacterium]